MTDWNRVVAQQLRALRVERGLTQQQAAALAEPHLGRRWSKVVWSSAEQSAYADRVRRFDANEIAAFAAAFDVPVGYFFAEKFPHDISTSRLARLLRSALEELNL